MPNRLADETSPYLLQHKDNPVDWYPWGDEALTRARVDDRPILLSIGYSACHWCHVMAHESFDDPATAAEMNRLFVNVKVDREWIVPHFEKMLYDNGPLLALYCDAWLVTRDPLYAKVASETAPYKYPRIVEFAESLPKTTSGKIKRAVLRGGAG